MRRRAGSKTVSSLGIVSQDSNDALNTYVVVASRAMKVPKAAFRRIPRRKVWELNIVQGYVEEG